MTYKFDDKNLEKVFAMVGEQYGEPVLPGEVTARMMYAEDQTVTQRTHLTRLKKFVEQGKLTCRVAKEGELAFRPVEDDG